VINQQHPLRDRQRGQLPQADSSASTFQG
jgi:hypothetical protein